MKRNLWLILIIAFLFAGISAPVEARVCHGVFEKLQAVKALSENEWAQLLGQQGQSAMQGKILTDEAYDVLRRLQFGALKRHWYNWFRDPFWAFTESVGLSGAYQKTFKEREKIYKQTTADMWKFLDNHKRQDTLMIIKHILQNNRGMFRKSVRGRLKDSYSDSLMGFYNQTIEAVDPQYTYHAVRAFAEYFGEPEELMQDFLFPNGY